MNYSKRLWALLFLLAVLLPQSIFAAALAAADDDYTTAGDGTTWTMTRLADTDGTGVTRDGTTYTMDRTVVIAAGDRFQIEGGITVRMATDVALEIQGTADLRADATTTFTRKDEDASPHAIYIKGDEQPTKVENIRFEYAGLRCFASKGLDVSRCSFAWHAASSAHGSAALTIGGSGSEYTVADCDFTSCGRAAIGGAANITNPIRIERCRFLYNGTENANYPQINLTAATEVIIRDCQIVGDREHTRVGGIVVSNMLGAATDPHTLIENCYLADNRYGIALYMGQDAVVRGNTLINNDTETDPNNGGSGINVYDPTATQTTMITANYIEHSLWGVSIIGGKEVNLGKTADTAAPDYNPGGNTFNRNGTGGAFYDVYNNSANTVYAQGNYWKTATAQTAEAIEEVVFHKHDNDALGEVVFTPFATEDTTPVETITATEQPTAVYGIDGTRQPSPRRGIHILRKGNRTIKVIRK